MRRTLLLALALAAIAPATAAADGLPAGIDADQGGVTAPNLDVNFVAVRAGHGTMVGRVEKRTGRLAASAYLDPPFVMPAVANDGTPGGISAGGGTLVLIRQRAHFPQRTTKLAVLDGRHLNIRKTLTLRGDFSYDAISPDAQTLYLIQYTDKRDFSQYAVRAYDLKRDRLVPGRIVDLREPDEDMSGYPITRATSAHGRWAYTLYDGTHHPFVHALDTVRRAAFCIDLDGLTKDELIDMSLSLGAGGRALTVMSVGRPAAVIDTRSLRVSDPAIRRQARPTAGDDRPFWPILGIAAVALLAVGVGLRRTARRRKRVLTGA